MANVSNIIAAATTKRARETLDEMETAISMLGVFASTKLKNEAEALKAADELLGTLKRFQEKVWNVEKTKYEGYQVIVCVKTCGILKDARNGLRCSVKVLSEDGAQTRRIHVQGALKGEETLLKLENLPWFVDKLPSIFAMIGKAQDWKPNNSSSVVHNFNYRGCNGIIMAKSSPPYPHLRLTPYSELTEEAMDSITLTPFLLVSCEDPSGQTGKGRTLTVLFTVDQKSASRIVMLDVKKNDIPTSELRQGSLYVVFNLIRKGEYNNCSTYTWLMTDREAASLLGLDSISLPLTEKTPAAASSSASIFED